MTMPHCYPRPRLAAVLTLGLAATAGAGELTQTFVNPDFGGSPLNGSYLLSNATAQNTHKEHVKPTPKAETTSTQADAAKQFAQQVNQLVMANLSQRLVNQAFGSTGDPLKPGSYLDTGTGLVSINSNGSSTYITIVDKLTGGRSVITIPNN